VSRANIPSMAGGIRKCRARSPRLIPLYDYEEADVLLSDGAPAEVAAKSGAGFFDGSPASTKQRCGKTRLHVGGEVPEVFDGFRVAVHPVLTGAFPVSRMVRQN